MKTILCPLPSSLMLVSHYAAAQIQLMPALNLVVARGNLFTGGSLSGRYFLTPHLAAGLNVRYVPAINLTMLTLEGDYYLLPARHLQPYIGLEGGLLGQYGDQTTYRARTPGIIPKLGLQGKLSSRLGLQLSGGYAMAIHRGETFGSDSGWILSLGTSFLVGDLKATGATKSR